MPADFPWSAGMLAIRASDGASGRVAFGDDGRTFAVFGYVRPWKAEESRPDLTDPATIGALAGAVREAWRDPYAHAVPLVEGSLVGPPRWRWRVLCAIPGPEPIRVRLRDFIDDDLGTAWLAAWAARPRSTP